MNRLLAGMLLGLVMLAGAADSSAQTNLVTPAQYLAGLPKPRFKPGHRLPHLTWAGWPLPETLRIETATNWGYTLDLTDADINTVSDLTNATSTTYRLVALASNYPSKFAVSVNVTRFFNVNMQNFPAVGAGFYCTNSAGQFVNNSTNVWTDQNDLSNYKFISPEGPDEYWELLSEFQASHIRAINSNVPVAIVLNAGEYGMSLLGGESTGWQKDPRVQAATNGFTFGRYASNRKAYTLGFLTRKIDELLPDRELSIFYNTDLERGRMSQPGYTFEANWGWFSDVMNTNTDYPSFENYFAGPESWTNATGVTWTQVTDLLTRHLNAVGYNLSIGYSNNYSWLCGGWTDSNSNRLAEIPRYMGFLKCLYTSGMVGGIAGYYSLPTNTTPTIFGSYGFTGSFPTNIVPHWLQQLEATARVHAQFSHLDDWLYDGTLLSGPQPHFISLDQPAYEFTNTVADATVRVLARKHRARDEWLITAWAAYGPNRNVTVNIPTLGALQLLARDCGSVYSATTTNLTLLDPNGLFPTEKRKPPAPANLQAGPGPAN